MAKRPGPSNFGDETWAANQQYSWLTTPGAADADALAGFYSLDAIRPDPEQPRELLPEALQQDFAAGRLTPFEVVEKWRQLAQISGEYSAAHRRFESLRQLAISIKEVGLINPITIRPAPAQYARQSEYLVVTGERRWWAHVLLHSQQAEIPHGDERRSAEQIRATVAEGQIMVSAHQLIENIMREDINVIERANGLMALREELSRAAHNKQEEVYWRDIESLLGISKRYRIHLTNTLQLEESAQRLISEHDLPERNIRPIVQKLRERPDLQLRAVRQVVQWVEEARGEGDDNLGRAITSTVEALVNRLLAEDQPVKRTARKVDDYVRFQRRGRQALRWLSRMEADAVNSLAQDLARSEDRDAVAEELREARARIDALLGGMQSTAGDND